MYSGDACICLTDKLLYHIYIYIIPSCGFFVSRLSVDSPRCYSRFSQLIVTMPVAERPSGCCFIHLVKSQPVKNWERDANEIPKLGMWWKMLGNRDESFKDEDAEDFTLTTLPTRNGNVIWILVIRVCPRKWMVNVKRAQNLKLEATWDI